MPLLASRSPVRAAFAVLLAQSAVGQMEYLTSSGCTPVDGEPTAALVQQEFMCDAAPSALVGFALDQFACTAAGERQGKVWCDEEFSIGSCQTLPTAPSTIAPPTASPPAPATISPATVSPDTGAPPTQPPATAPPPTPAPPATATERAAGTVKDTGNNPVYTSAAAVSGSTAAGALAVVGAVLECMLEHSIDGELELVIHPLGFRILGSFHAGAILGNTLIFSASAALIIAVTAALQKIRRTTWENACATARFPSILGITPMFLIPGTLQCSTELLLYPRDLKLTAVGLLGLGLCTVFFYLVFWTTRKANFHSKSLPHAAGGGVKAYLLGTTVWVSTSSLHTERLGLMFDMYAPPVKPVSWFPSLEYGGYVLWEVGHLLPLSVLTVVRASTWTRCALKSFGLSLIFLLYLASCLRLRPFLASFMNHLVYAMTLIPGVGLLLIGIAFLSHDINSPLMTAGAYCFQAAMILTLVRTFYEVAMWLLDACVSRREKARKAAVKQQADNCRADPSDADSMVELIEKPVSRVEGMSGVKASATLYTDGGSSAESSKADRASVNLPVQPDSSFSAGSRVHHLYHPTDSDDDACSGPFCASSSATKRSPFPPLAFPRRGSVEPKQQSSGPHLQDDVDISMISLSPRFSPSSGPRRVPNEPKPIVTPTQDDADASLASLTGTPRFSRVSRRVPNEESSTPLRRGSLEPKPFVVTQDDADASLASLTGTPRFSRGSRRAGDAAKGASDNESAATRKSPSEPRAAGALSQDDADGSSVANLQGTHQFTPWHSSPRSSRSLLESLVSGPLGDSDSTGQLPSHSPGHANEAGKEPAKDAARKTPLDSKSARTLASDGVAEPVRALSAPFSSASRTLRAEDAKGLGGSLNASEESSAVPRRSPLDSKSAGPVSPGDAGGTPASDQYTPLHGWPIEDGTAGVASHLDSSGFPRSTAGRKGDAELPVPRRRSPLEPESVASRSLDDTDRSSSRRTSQHYPSNSSRRKGDAAGVASYAELPALPRRSSLEPESFASRSLEDSDRTHAWRTSQHHRRKEDAAELPALPRRSSLEPSSVGLRSSSDFDGTSTRSGGALPRNTSVEQESPASRSKGEFDRTSTRRTSHHYPSDSTRRPSLEPTTAGDLSQDDPGHTPAAQNHPRRVGDAAMGSTAGEDPSAAPGRRSSIEPNSISPLSPLDDSAGPRKPTHYHPMDSLRRAGDARRNSPGREESPAFPNGPNTVEPKSIGPCPPDDADARADACPELQTQARGLGLRSPKPAWRRKHSWQPGQSAARSPAAGPAAAPSSPTSHVPPPRRRVSMPAGVLHSDSYLVESVNNDSFP
ncbi:hypothetical protein DIPPA_26665 [Diplonema papillatum]|nr:hypothetical protein DIPPA_26665 [Diplonema papillatum]